MSSKPIDSPTIAHLLNNASQWAISPKGGWLAIVYNDKNESRDYSVSDEDLTGIHEKLPQAMRSIMEFRKKYKAPLIAYKEEAVDTVSFLRGETLAVLSDERRTVFKTIDKINILDSASGEIILLGTSFSIWKCQTLGEPTPIVTNRAFSSISITKTELDIQLPGWCNRLETGKALGLDEPQLYQFVFFKCPTVTVNVELNHISFE